MKKLKGLIVISSFALMGGMLMAQAPQTPAANGKGGGGRGMMPQVPPAPGPLMDVANKIADSINKQDAATLSKMLAQDCVYLDEDGHSPPVASWVTKLTASGKKIEISSTHGQVMDDAAWLSFNYVVSETFQGNPKS